MSSNHDEDALLGTASRFHASLLLQSSRVLNSPIILIKIQLRRVGPGFAHHEAGQKRYPGYFRWGFG